MYVSCKTISLQDEWRYLLAGGTHKPKDLPNPAPDWMSERAWGDILSLPALKKFTTFADSFSELKEGYKTIFDSPEPHTYVAAS